MNSRERQLATILREPTDRISTEKVVSNLLFTKLMPLGILPENQNNLQSTKNISIPYW
jgi:hypothetical protein